MRALYVPLPQDALDKLGHPVIDIDGHTVEFFPALAGDSWTERFVEPGESI